MSNSTPKGCESARGTPKEALLAREKRRGGQAKERNSDVKFS